MHRVNVLQVNTFWERHKSLLLERFASPTQNDPDPTPRKKLARGEERSIKMVYFQSVERLEQEDCQRQTFTTGTTRFSKYPALKLQIFSLMKIYSYFDFNLLFNYAMS